MVTPTSYLQTLTNDEAIAFVASLQKVKDHLSQELHWVSEQVQQKTAQLQGIETLLFEAEALGLIETNTHSMTETASATVAPLAPITTTDATDESALELPATTNGSLSPNDVEPIASAIAALSTPKPSKQASHTKPGPKAAANSKANASKAKQPKPSTLTAGKANQRGRTSNLQGFLKSEWRDKALTEAVGDVLDRAAESLSTDEVMAALYDGLSTADYDRAKHSLANILSVGKSKKAWQSTSRGRYASNSQG